MKSFCLFAIVGLVAAVSFGSESYGQTFLLQPSGLQKTWRSMPRAFRNELSGATTAKLVRSFEIPQARMVRSMPFPRIPRTQIASALGGRIFRNDMSGATTEKIIRSLSRGYRKENVHNKQFNEQRVLRTPVSETVTQLPDEVTRITRNIDTHMPMVHERIRNHYSVENINKKNIVHHYISPVRDENLGKYILRFYLYLYF